jgi:hypothetical protein
MNAEAGMQNVEKLQVPDTHCEIQVHDAGFWILDSEVRIFSIEYQASSIQYHKLNK